MADDNSRYTIEFDLFKRIDKHLSDVKDGLQEVREKLIVIEAQDWKEKLTQVNQEVDKLKAVVEQVKLEQVAIKTKLIPITGFGTIIITALITAWVSGVF